MDFVVVNDTDAVWRDRSNWAWTIEPAFRNDFFAVYKCNGPLFRAAR